MSDTYAFGYVVPSVYSHVVGLIDRNAVKEGVHLDVGCGFGAIAEPTRDLGLTYLGADFDDSGLDSLKSRGFETTVIDLQDVERSRQLLEDLLGERRLASISMLDTLEHITNGPAVLTMLRELSVSRGAVPLISSVTNVSHVDVAAKMMMARWDWTETGLLDQTHVAFYNGKNLAAVTRSSGWVEIDENDYRLTISDQHFPPDSVALNQDTTLGRVLFNLRRDASPDYNVNQFVRAYLPTTPGGAPLVVERDSEPEPFLSIILRTQGRRSEALRDVMLCLAGQSSDDFEVVLLVHKAESWRTDEVRVVVDDQPSWLRDRIRIVVETEGGRARPLNRGASEARGRYVCALDDDDLVFAHWVQSFVDLGRQFPGRMLRALSVEQDFGLEQDESGRNVPTMVGGYRTPFPDHFNIFQHTIQNYTPLMVCAFPRQLFAEMGMRFDESLPVCEDWDFILRSALTCGVASTPHVTAIYRKWDTGDASDIVHAEREWLEAAANIVTKLNREPILLPPGYFEFIRLTMNELNRTHYVEEKQAESIAVYEEYLRARDQRIAELQRSTSWRITRPLRGVGRVVRIARSAARRAARLGSTS